MGTYVQNIFDTYKKDASNKKQLTKDALDFLRKSLDRRIKELLAAIFFNFENKGNLEFKWKPKYTNNNTNPSFKLSILFKDKWMKVIIFIVFYLN